MIHLLTLRNGENYEIEQRKRDAITTALYGPRDKRPDYIELSEGGTIVSTSAIISIKPFRREPEPLPTKEQELKAFNERWKSEHNTQKP